MRRRTPGLRREEVAQLAGVGLTWYTWLEQGRPITPSAQVLDAIARTLQLAPVEHQHLHRLAADTLAPAPPPREVPGSVLQVLDALDPIPAVLLGPRWDRLAANLGYEALTSQWHTVPCAHSNLLWCIMTEPRSPERMLNYDTEIPWLVGRFRASFADHVGDPLWTEFVNELSDESPEFAELWARHDIFPTEERVKRMWHPETGEIDVTSSFLVPAALPGTVMQIYNPVDPLSHGRLLELMQDH